MQVGIQVGRGVSRVGLWDQKSGQESFLMAGGALTCSDWCVQHLSSKYLPVFKQGRAAEFKCEKKGVTWDGSFGLNSWRRKVQRAGEVLTCSFVHRYFHGYPLYHMNVMV